MTNQRGKRNIVVGVALILLGIIFLLQNFDVIRVENWWAAFVIAIGISFFFGWFYDRTQTGLLLPGSILVILGCQFLFLHWDWPIFIMAPAVGFWLMYFLGHEDRGVLVPAFVLTVIALVFWLQDSFLEEYWPVLFIVAGIGLLFWRHPENSRKRNLHDYGDEHDEEPIK